MSSVCFWQSYICKVSLIYVYECMYDGVSVLQGTTFIVYIEEMKIFVCINGIGPCKNCTLCM